MCSSQAPGIFVFGSLAHFLRTALPHAERQEVKGVRSSGVALHRSQVQWIPFSVACFHSRDIASLEADQSMRKKDHDRKWLCTSVSVYLEL